MSIQVNGESIFTKETANVKMAEVIECPDCAFEFATIHEQSDAKGIYTCPNCEAVNLEVLSLQQKDALEQIAYHVATPIGESENYEKTVYEFINIAKRALGY